jgi:hypothetical protein
MGGPSWSRLRQPYGRPCRNETFSRRDTAAPESNYDPRVSSRRLGGVVLLLASAVVLLPSSASPSARVASSAAVSLRFDHGTLGGPVTPVNKGTAADVTASVVTAGTGTAVVARSRAGQGNAIDLPSRADAVADRLAVVRLEDTDLANGDALSPGTDDFTFGADFILDGGALPDPGNNVVQRGLFKSSDQFKIQVDRVNGQFRPECSLGETVDGTWSTVKATLARPVYAGRWYQVRCRRSGTSLVLSVFSFVDGTRTLWSEQTVTDVPLFDLTWPQTAPVAPMTVGGKLWPDGRFAPDDDQLNGRVDNVLLRVG